MLFVLTNKLHLPALVFMRSSLSHLNNLRKAFGKDLTTLSMLFALTYGVLSRA